MQKELKIREGYELMGNARLSDILRHKALIVKWFEALEQLALARLLRGDELPGLALVETKTHRRWKVSEEEIKRELGLLGINAYKQDMKTVAAVERELGDRHKELISRLIEKPRGRLKVVVTEESIPFGLLEE